MLRLKTKTEWKLSSHFNILRVVGRGSYGEVVEARDARMGASLAAKVAVKRLLIIQCNIIEGYKH